MVRLLWFVSFGSICLHVCGQECKSLSPYIVCFNEIVGHKVPSETAPLRLHLLGPNISLILDLEKTSSSHNLGVFDGHISLTMVNENGHKDLSYAVNHFIGNVAGDIDSYVHGHMLGNVFDGVIHTKMLTYFVEAATKYFICEGCEAMVIYERSDIIYDEVVQKYNVNLNDHVGSSTFSHNSSFSFKNFEQVKHKRASDSALTDMRMCNVHVIVDHLFYELMTSKSKEATLHEVIYYFSEADYIFRTTDFNGDGFGDNIGFIIDQVTIYENVNAENNLMKEVVSDVKAALEQFSSGNFEGWCLGLFLCYREFTEGVIGYAWMASSSDYGQPGGICQQQVQIGTHLKSYNTLLVSTTNFGSPVPRDVASLTLSHELGHSFGAPHDPIGNEQCSSTTYGQFLMHPYASSSHQVNNRRFSSCSIMNVLPVLKSKGRCFENIRGNMCGNRILEEGEECDCGLATHCSMYDPCCLPPQGNISQLGCRIDRTHGKQCSPYSSRCCNENCQFVSTKEQSVCLAETECTYMSVCDGTRGDCPLPKHKPNGTLCNNGLFVCQDGKCSLSLCEKHDMQDCQCTDEAGSLYMCRLCCRCSKGNNSAPCVPASFLGITGPLDTDLIYPAGSPCGNYNGYCGIDHICIKTKYVNIIERIKSLFELDSSSNVLSWFMQYWYFVFFGLVCIILIVTFFVILEKNRNPQKVARKYTSRVNKLLQIASDECDKLQEQLDKLEERFSTVVGQFSQSFGDVRLSSTEQLTRLHTMFPTVPTNIHKELIQQNLSEYECVRAIASAGFPMRPMFNPQDNELRLPTVSELVTGQQYDNINTLQCQQSPTDSNLLILESQGTIHQHIHTDKPLGAAFGPSDSTDSMASSVSNQPLSEQMRTLAVNASVGTQSVCGVKVAEIISGGTFSKVDIISEGHIGETPSLSTSACYSPFPKISICQSDHVTPIITQVLAKLHQPTTVVQVVNSACTATTPQLRKIKFKSVENLASDQGIIPEQFDQHKHQKLETLQPIEDQDQQQHVEEQPKHVQDQQLTTEQDKQLLYQNKHLPDQDQNKPDQESQDKHLQDQDLHIPDQDQHLPTEQDQQSLKQDQRQLKTKPLQHTVGEEAANPIQDEHETFSEIWRKISSTQQPAVHSSSLTASSSAPAPEMPLTNTGTSMQVLGDTAISQSTERKCLMLSAVSVGTDLKAHFVDTSIVLGSESFVSLGQFSVQMYDDESSIDETEV